MLIATNEQRQHMLERQIYFADKYKREHPGTEMMVVEDNCGYHGDVLREHTKGRIVYRTDQPEQRFAVEPLDTVACVVHQSLDNGRQGIIADMVADTYGF